MSRSVSVTPARERASLASRQVVQVLNQYNAIVDIFPPVRSVDGTSDLPFIVIARSRSRPFFREYEPGTVFKDVAATLEKEGDRFLWQLKAMNG
jgi:hypothetical protein